MSNGSILLIPILLPVIAGIICYCIPDGLRKFRNVIALISGFALFLIVANFYKSGNLIYVSNWFFSTIVFSLKEDSFSRFILLWLSVFSFLITLYVSARMANERSREFITYLLITCGFACGAVLANSLLVLLFFWEGLLITLYLFICLGGKKSSHRTALKGFILVGFCDFCFILGVILYWRITGSFDFPDSPVALKGVGILSFSLMVLGATGKAGALPFHTWIPDAAIDAPVGFMAFLPGAFEKLIGIYLLVKICFNLFSLVPGSGASMGLMILGAFTIVIAVCMALIQKDIKRLLSYHAISQVGYMILGIGTGVPAGIVGGIFHMLNHAIYKSALFLGAGSVEQRTGTTDLKSLGGLYKEMPITGLCFIICSCAISGIWPLNGYISKEMIIDGCLETGYKIFAISAWLGAIFTFASFLKAMHSIFLGERNVSTPRVKEVGLPMLLPMIILALLCIIFGLFSSIPLVVISKFVPQGHMLHLSSHPLNLFNTVSGITILCLIAAFLLHRYGWLKNDRKPYLASEVVHNLPVIHTIYNLAERRFFDIYEQAIKFVKVFALALYYGFDRSSDWLYEKLVVESGIKMIKSLKSLHRGFISEYVGWIFIGMLVIAIFMFIL
ncbi:MAG: Na(+)/H(+) antiporter subunit D [candidate division TA06 bacterium ADurb.Bin131]|uniref:Na(+)/H(+) antiporter subunit D n=1 Tax=candidate division TA06 bacterium ADurb.Bin131 TaxID=1852827 RepID=A0A1V6C5N7_UNCT6|nr:MAG: Na(+)/H(+) antiporter subunit D [candidate division TA06 bacterium ADurb.Bin131]